MPQVALIARFAAKQGKADEQIAFGPVSRTPRLVLAAAGLSLATALAACGTVGYSQLPGNLPVPVFSFHGQLQRVAGASASDAWAVGFSGTVPHEGTLMLHWNGATWSRVTSPAVVDGAPGILEDVTAVSASDAWAVGYAGVTALMPAPGGVTAGSCLLLHWDGTRWSQVAGVLPANGCLSAITVSSQGGWAVGSAHVAGHWQPLILRRDGAGWHRVTAPVNGDGLGLTRVVVTSAGMAWASGVVPSHTSPPIHSELIGWNGSSWQLAAFPIAGPANVLTDMATGPDGTAWAVGQDTTAASQPGTRRVIASLAMRWTGATWQEVHVPGGRADIGGVTVAPDGTVWAVGGGDAGVLAARWTGSAWAVMPVPTGWYPDNDSALSSVTFSSPTYGWAVGVDWVPGTGKHSGDWPLIVHWDGTNWN
jgi:hypothetical protein